MIEYDRLPRQALDKHEEILKPRGCCDHTEFKPVPGAHVFKTLRSDFFSFAIVSNETLFESCIVSRLHTMSFLPRPAKDEGVALNERGVWTALTMITRFFRGEGHT